MNATHGFQDTMTALPRMADELVAFFLHATAGAGPGAAEDCVLFLVGRSERDPDTVFVTEGRTTLHHHSPRLQVVAGHRERRMTVDGSRARRASRCPAGGCTYTAQSR